MSIDQITVLGAGTMGHGIAINAATAGYHVTLHDVSPEAVEAGMSRIKAFLDKGVARGKTTEKQRDDAIARVTGAADFAEAVSQADLVIEAAPEQLELKKKIFSDLGQACPAHTLYVEHLLMPVTEMALASSRRLRSSAHSLTLVPIMKLLEVIVTDFTAPETKQALLTFAERLGKTTAVIKDSPGFATSRLGIAIALEAIRMVEQEVAEPHDIDTCGLGYRFPMGVRLTWSGSTSDLGSLTPSTRRLSASIQAPDLLRQMVNDGSGESQGKVFIDMTYSDVAPRSERASTART